MSTLTPELRTIRARVAAFAKHSKHDPAVDCAKAREALWAKYRAQVDPEGTLDPVERDRRVRAALRADLARRALASAKARQAAQDVRLADALLEVS